MDNPPGCFKTIARPMGLVRVFKKAFLDKQVLACPLEGFSRQENAQDEGGFSPVGRPKREWRRSSYQQIVRTTRIV